MDYTYVVQALERLGLPIAFAVLFLIGIVKIWKYYTLKIDGMDVANRGELSRLAADHRAEVLGLVQKIETLHNEKADMAEKFGETVRSLIDIIKDK